MKLAKKIIFLVLALMMLIQVPISSLAIEQTNSDLEGEYHRDNDLADHDFDDDYIPDGWYDPEFGDLDTEPTEPTLPEEATSPDSEEASEPAAVDISPTSAQQTTVIHRTGVTVVNANFRRGPATSYDNIRTVPANSNVRITGRRGNFYRVVHSGTTGWIHRNSVQQTRVTAIVTVINATVRTGPAASYGSFTTLPSGTQVLVGDRRAHWAQVTVNGRTGWIHTNSLAFGNGRRPGRARATVAVHTRPNAETNVMRRLPQGHEFMVIQRTTNGDDVHQGWTQIRTRHNGETITGWIRSNQVEFAGQVRRTTGGGTHPVRTGPSADFRLVQRIPNNTQVRVLAEAGNWSRIRYTLNGVTRYGWIASNRLAVATSGVRTLTTAEALSYQALVNNNFRLSSNFSPPDLRTVNVRRNGNQRLRSTAATQAEALFAAANRNGHTLIAVSGYRSYATQTTVHNNHIANLGVTEARRISARPGHSEHQLGLALDLSTPDLNGQLLQRFSSTPEGRWVRNNAHRFGFIIRYPHNREADTGFVYEPWHIRYVGVETATTIFNRGLILEEFLGH